MPKTSRPRDIDRRGTFFLCAALLCLLLVPTALPKLRWVGEVLAVAQVVLALLSFADHAARRRRHT